MSRINILFVLLMSWCIALTGALAVTLVAQEPVVAGRYGP